MARLWTERSAEHEIRQQTRAQPTMGRPPSKLDSCHVTVPLPAWRRHQQWLGDDFLCVWDLLRNGRPASHHLVARTLRQPFATVFDGNAFPMVREVGWLWVPCRSA